MGLGFKGLLFLEENLSTGHGNKNVHQGQNIFVLQHNTYLKQILWLILHNIGFGSEYLPKFLNAEHKLNHYLCSSARALSSLGALFVLGLSAGPTESLATLLLPIYLIKTFNTRFLYLLQVVSQTLF